MHVLLKKTDSQSNSSKSLTSWGEIKNKALDQLLLCLVELPILVYADHDKEFILHVEASGKRLGPVLLKYQESDLRLICYGSRTLIPVEKKYHSSELEFSGVTQTVVYDQFRDYLCYTSHFHIYTGNNLVTFTISIGKLTATDQRWVHEQAELLFALHYKPGKENIIISLQTH